MVAYPGALSALSNPAGTDFMSDPTILHSNQHSNANDEIDAIEAELGLNPRGTYATVRARLDTIETNSVETGAMFVWPGVDVPSAAYAFCYGQELSRTTYAVLLSRLSKTYTVNTTNASLTVSGTFPATGTLNLVGMPVSGTNIQTGTTITAQTTTQLTLSLAATGTTSGVALLVAPWGVGNGTTTFNAPDMRGRNPMGRDDMGGSDAARISTANRLGATAGAEANTLAAGNIPGHTHTIDHGHADTIAVDALAGTTTSGVDTPDHTHIIPDHSHYAFTWGGGGSHAHSNNIADILTTGGGGSFRKGYSAGGEASSGAGGHEHSVGTSGVGNIATWGVYDNRHTHTIGHSHTKSGGVTAMTGASGSTGTATAFNSLDPHAIVNWIIKL